MSGKVSFTVFTKPWQDKPLPELARLVRGMGFDGIELPVRPGFQVTPERIMSDLPKAARILADEGLRIGSVAGNCDAATIQACGEAGVPILRVMARVDMTIGYAATEKQLRSQWDPLLPVLEKSRVKIGVQNHAGQNVGSAIGLMHLIEGYDPKLVGAVLDPAHCGLDGEPEEIAIDIVWTHLAMVNLKNAFRVREVGPEYDDVRWKVYWTNGHQGFTSWPAVATELKRRGYAGDLCLTAEYSNPLERGDKTGADVEPLAAADLAYARSLFE
ncbi:MAG TPA: TIM barrel protein [Spirochaetia bacterium]|nr:TIM barrel protein [Spirochaetia bacterium]